MRGKPQAVVEKSLSTPHTVSAQVLPVRALVESRASSPGGVDAVIVGGHHLTTLDSSGRRGNPRMDGAWRKLRWRLLQRRLARLGELLVHAFELLLHDRWLDEVEVEEPLQHVEEKFGFTGL